VSGVGISERVHKRGRGLGKKTLATRAHVLDVFGTFDGSMSTRQVYYQLVSRGAVQNNVKAYGTVQRLLVAMRRDGSVSYARVVDRTRSKHQRPGWDGVAEAMGAISDQYRRDLWTSQPTRVHICCEKQALEGIFAEVVDEYGAALWVIRGFDSDSFVYEWAEAIKQETEDGARVVVVYFGDHDPSGLEIENVEKRKLREFGAEFDWVRAGLLWEDFERFDLVNVDVKKGDSRTKKYVERFGNRAAELDALHPEELRRRIHEAIKSRINMDAWVALKRTERLEQQSLNVVRFNWDAAVEGARRAA